MEGFVIGVDRSIDQARTIDWPPDDTAGVVKFEEADVYKLPFADASFDAVFAHALIEHLQEPINAAKELLRVLKPGGVIGLRSPDWGGFLLEPFDKDIQSAIQCYKNLMTGNGADIFAGRKLASMFRNAGAGRVRLSATYEIYEDTSLIARYLAAQLDNPHPSAAAILREWGKLPHAHFAQAWGEAIGRREPQRTLAL